MKYHHTNRPGFLLGLIDFCTAGLFFLIYMPLLNMCFAIQYGHWYVITQHETRQPVTVWLLVAMFAAFIIAMVIA